jgi:hypothetical protein
MPAASFLAAGTACKTQQISNMLRRRNEAQQQQQQLCIAVLCCTWELERQPLLHAVNYRTAGML